MSTESTPHLVPFVIGVTGSIRKVREMDANDRHQLRHLVRDQIFAVLNDAKKFARWCSPDGKPIDPIRLTRTPIILVTSLADGADRLVVEAALEFAGTAGADVRVVPILPRPLQRDERGILRNAPYPEFAQLLEPWREAAIELPVLEDGDDELQFAFAGFLIAKLSRLVIALPDPDPDEANKVRLGGTNHVVAMARSGRLDSGRLRDALIRLHDSQDQSPTAVAATRLRELGLDRRSLELFDPCPVLEVDLRAATATEPWLTLRPSAAGELHPQFHDTFHHEGPPENCGACEHHALERLHSHLASYRGSVANLDWFNRQECSITASPDDLLEPLDAGSSYSDTSLIYLRANQLAKRLQKKIELGRKCVVAAVGLSAIFFVLAAHGLRDEPCPVHEPLLHAEHAEHTEAGVSLPWWVFTAYLISLAVAYRIHTSFTTGGRQDSERRFWDVRALAEGLRVQYFWRRAGIRTSIARHFLGHQNSALPWVQFALDALEIDRLREARQQDSEGGDRFRAVMLHWVRRQMWFYFDRAQSRHAKHAAAETHTAVLLLGSILFTAWQCMCHLGLPWSALPLALAFLVTRRWFDSRRREAESPSHASGSELPAALWMLALIGGSVWFLALLGERHAFGCLFSDHPFHWTVIGIVAPAIVAGLIHARSQLSGWAAEGRRFDRMVGVYRAACTRLGETAGIAECPPPLPARASTDTERDYSARFEHCIDRIAANSDAVDRAGIIIEALGRASLAEHADWVMVRRDHPLDVPHAI